MTKEITVRCIQQSRMNQEQMLDWLVDLGAHDFAEKLTDQDLSDAETMVGVAGKRCYNSFEIGLNPNVTKIREDWGVYLDNVLASGHGSVLEHAVWTWAIEGCSRVFTAEGNRHRAGVAISEASLRYIRFKSGDGQGISYWEPISIRELPEPTSWAQGGQVSQTQEQRQRQWHNLEAKKLASRVIFDMAFNDAFKHYRALEAVWANELSSTEPQAFNRKKALTSMFRRIIPLGVSVGIIYTFNCRALRHIMTMRCDPTAEEEIAYVFGMIAKHMVQSEPKLFGDFVQDEFGFWKPKYRKV